MMLLFPSGLQAKLVVFVHFRCWKSQLQVCDIYVHVNNCIVHQKSLGIATAWSETVVKTFVCICHILESLVRLSVCPGFIPMMSYEPLKRLNPNLILWCIINEPECLVKGLHEGHCHSGGIYNQNMIVPSLSSELLIPSQPKLAWWYIIIIWNVLWKDQIAVFKV